MQTLLIAARRPFALAVLFAAVVAGLTTAIWMLPLGIAVYVATVALAARDPALTTIMQQSARSASISRLTSPTFRAIVEEIDRSHRDIERSASQTEGSLAALMQRISDQTRELVSQAHVLATKGQTIEQYLAVVNYRQLHDQINQVDDQLARTSDTYTIQQLQETRKALVDRQTNAQALETYIGRIMAQLQNIDANLDNVLVETVRLRTADAVSIDSTSNQVTERLNDLNSDMDAFQRVLDTALLQSGARA
jgi:chromosome segregation ATPase